jgi:hypothetical protein
VGWASCPSRLTGRAGCPPHHWIIYFLLIPKLYLKELLSPFGEVETTREVYDSVRFRVYTITIPCLRVPKFRGRQRLILENLLKVRFGSVDDELAEIIEPMLELAPEEYTPLVLQLSREQLLARFRFKTL